MASSSDEEDEDEEEAVSVQVINQSRSQPNLTSKNVTVKERAYQNNVPPKPSLLTVQENESLANTQLSKSDPGPAFASSGKDNNDGLKTMVEKLKLCDDLG